MLPKLLSPTNSGLVFTYRFFLVDRGCCCFVRFLVLAAWQKAGCRLVKEACIAVLVHWNAYIICSENG